MKTISAIVLHGHSHGVHHFAQAMKLKLEKYIAMSVYGVCSILYLPIAQFLKHVMLLRNGRISANSMNYRDTIHNSF